MTSYKVTFARIGRNHNVAPLLTEANDADHLAEKIYHYARPYLLSRDVEVMVTEDRGHILCGFNSGGNFTIEQP